MPFLKHLVEPQLRKAEQQLRTELPPTPPAPPLPTERLPASSYLQAGNIDAPVQKTPSQVALEQLRADAAQRTPMSVFRNSATQAAMQADKDAKHLQFPVVPVPEPVTAQPTTDKRGRVTIPMGAPGEPIAVNERGEAIDSFGKNLGYLQSGPTRSGAYTPQDLHGNLAQALRYGNPDAPKMLYEQYGEHLKAMQENRDAQGMPTDKFPAGYFKGMSKEEKKNIIEGVKMLRDFERPVTI